MGKLSVARLASIVLAFCVATASGLGWVCAVALFLALPLRAQTAQTNTTTITSSSELVLIPAVVNNSSGSHISGLKKEDFVLKQDGKPRPIAIFEEVKTNTARVRRAEGEHETFSNIEPDVAEYHRLSIIVLDFVNTPVLDQVNARSALIKFLTEVANSGEPMCLLALTRGGLTLLHDFTDDPKLLAEGLNRAVNNSPLIHEEVVDPQHPPEPDGPNTPVKNRMEQASTITQLIRDQLQTEAEQAALENKIAASITVQALLQIAKAFRGLPGRKSLIWASSGFPFSLVRARYLCVTPHARSMAATRCNRPTTISGRR